MRCQAQRDFSISASMLKEGQHLRSPLASTIQSESAKIGVRSEYQPVPVEALYP